MTFESRKPLVQGTELILNEGNSGILKLFVEKVICYEKNSIAYVGKICSTLDLTSSVEKVVLKEFYPVPESGYDVHRELESDCLIVPDNKNEDFISKGWEVFDGSFPFTSIARANNTIYTYTNVNEVIILREWKEIEGQPEKKDIALIMSSVCDYIQKVHKEGFLYLNCSPESIYLILGKDSKPEKVCMFDFAMIKSKNGVEHHHHSYMDGWAPIEQVHEEKRYIDVSADIYAVGAVFFWLLTGEKIKIEEDHDDITSEFLWNNFSDLIENTDVNVPLIKKIVMTSLHNAWNARYINIAAMKKDFDKLVKRYAEGNSIGVDTEAVGSDIVPKLVEREYLDFGEWNGICYYNGYHSADNLNGDHYDGEWSGGRFHGIGVYQWKDGKIYEGFWKNGVPEGKGQYRSTNGDVYEGNFVNEEMKTEGRLILIGEKPFGNSLHRAHATATDEVGVPSKKEIHLKNDEVYMEKVKDSLSNSEVKEQFSDGEVNEKEWKDEETVDTELIAVMAAAIAASEETVSADDYVVRSIVRRHTQDSPYAATSRKFVALGNDGLPDDNPYVKGLEYYKGKQYLDALYSFKIAAKNGNLYAHCILGEMYQYGEGVQKDYAEAVKWYEQAAIKGEPNAQAFLGYMYHHGLGVNQDLKQAISWYRQSADQGNVIGQNNMGFMYFKGSGVEKDYKEAMKWFKLAADKNYDAAQVWVAYLYGRGLGVSKDCSEALSWYMKAAEMGNADAQYEIGNMYNMYLYGCVDGIKQDYNEALKWYRKAAVKGYSREYSCIGYIYQFGIGVEQNLEEAMIWHHKPAEKGKAEAQYALGVMYQRGWGTPVDDKEAIKWIRYSANQGYVHAQTEMGVAYLHGKGVSQNYSEAMHWFKMSADQGTSEALFRVGFMYENGMGVQADRSEAIKWYRMASGRGSISAKERLLSFPEVMQEELEIRVGKCISAGLSKEALDEFTSISDAEDAAKWLDNHVPNWRAIVEEEKSKQKSEQKQWLVIGAQAKMTLGEKWEKEGLLGEAFKAYLDAAKKNYIRVFHIVGYCYERGKGTNADKFEAIKWYQLSKNMDEKAEVEGLARIKRELGDLFRYDVDTAKKFRQKIAEANYMAGVCYEQGYIINEDIQQDIEKARIFYKLAADAGNEEAQAAYKRMS